MPKIKIDSNLYDRLKRASEVAGYSSVEEFVTHMIEKELAGIEMADEDEKVAERLRGLGVHRVTDLPARIIAWINVAANAAGGVVLAPVGMLPGWLSNTIVSAVVGVVLLVLFKYTSNQRAIARVRDGMKANMLALKLFKDSLAVTLTAQARVFRGGVLLAFHAIPPVLVMVAPVSLLLSQMGLWYQHRPLKVGEHAVVTMTMNSGERAPLPDARIASMPSARVTVGPVRVFSKREVCWEIQGREAGRRPIVFNIDGREVEKQLSVGDGFMRVSVLRPGLRWTDVLLNPWEEPFGRDSAVQSVRIDYPERSSWTSGTDWWVAYFFAASLVFALIFKPILKVKL